MVLHLVELAVGAALHVDDGFDVARLDFHDDSHTHQSVYIFVVELPYDGTLSQVLHVHIDGGHDVGTIGGRRVGDVQILVEHLAAVYDAVLATQQTVVELFQSVLGFVLAGVEGAQGALGERPVGVLARVKILAVEAAGVAA